MTTTMHLAAAELHIRIARHEAHARAALAALGRARLMDRARRTGHGSERVTAREWRRARRHTARAAQARAWLAKLTGGAT
jgi:hypothetical protein